MGIRTVSLLETWQKDLGKQISASIGGETPSIISAITEGEDLGSIMADFQKFFATPMMQMFQEEVVPTIREGFNLPGAFYSSARFEGVAKATESFIGETISPAAFSTMEAFRGREVQRAGIGAQVLGIGAGIATQPTLQAFYKGKEKKTGLGGAIGGAIGLGANLAFPGLGAALGGSGAALSGFEMGSMGALFGGAF